MQHTHHIIFPLPVPLHIGFVVVSSLLLIFCYIKTKRRYDLYMLIGVLSTLLIDIMIQKPYFYIFAAEELTLLVLTIIDMHKVSKENEARKAAAEKAAEEKTADDSVEDTAVKSDDDAADEESGTENTNEDSAS